MKRFPFEGEHLTLSAIGRRVGMDAGTLYGRIYYRGMSIEDAVAMPITPRHLAYAGKQAKRHQFQGEMLTVREVAARTGVPVHTLRYRMRQHGLSLADAVTPPVRRSAPPTPTPPLAFNMLPEVMIADRRMRLRNRQLIRCMTHAFSRAKGA